VLIARQCKYLRANVDGKINKNFDLYLHISTFKKTYAIIVRESQSKNGAFNMKSKGRENICHILVRVQICIAFVLLVLALAKQHSISMPHALASLDNSDYVIDFITKRQSFAAAAVIEMFVAVAIVVFRKSLLGYLVLGAFSSALAGYRIIMFKNVGLAPCNCMGTLADWFSISVRSESVIMLLFIVLMVSVSILGIYTKTNGAESVRAEK